MTNAAGYDLRYVDEAGHSFEDKLFASGSATITLLLTYRAQAGTNQPGSPLAIAPYVNIVLLADTVPGLAYYAETTDPSLATRYAALAAGTAATSLSRADSVMHLRPSSELAEASGAVPGEPHRRKTLLASLQARGVVNPDRIRALLVASGSAPASLNALYSLLAYRIEATAGFSASNLSAPIQPQKQTAGDTTGAYRIVAPLYAVANGNEGSTTPNRYASIGAEFQLSFVTCDAFGNALPTPLRETGTNLYFDPLLPLDLWQGIVPSFDFSRKTASTLTLRLEPSAAAFTGLSGDALAAAAAHYRTIRDQVCAKGVSFFVETSLALDADSHPTIIPLESSAATAITTLVSAMLAYLSGPAAALPTALDIDVALPASVVALPPAFALTVIFGIERDPALLAVDVKESFPAARYATSAIVANSGGSSGLGGFASDFATAFPLLRLAVGQNGIAGAAKPTRAERARLAARGRDLDAPGRAGGDDQSLWAVAASLLAIEIGTGTDAGPRYLSPKPLSNALVSDTIPLPDLAPPLPGLNKTQLFVDVDLDRLNRIFFQALDDALAPASAARAFELSDDHAVYDALARGRGDIAEKYAAHEVDWLFDAHSPFTGSDDRRQAARDAFEAQMRAALMSAYSIDTIVQYEAAWTSPPPASAAGRIELFGRIEAVLAGSYAWTGTLITCATKSPHGLRDGDKVLVAFTAVTGAAPDGGLKPITVVDAKTFRVSASGSGNGDGRFTAALNEAGLSAAHLPVPATGTSPLTILYGNPDASRTSDAATIALDLRYTVTDLQLFLVDKTSEPDAARPSIWLQLVAPVAVHAGPAGPTTIPIVFRQYPTPPTFVGQGWLPPTAKGGSSPVEKAARWRYAFTYQAMLAAQDQIDATLTYNTDARVKTNRARAFQADGTFSLFAALARFSAVYGAVLPSLADVETPNWGAAITALSRCVTEVATNKDWSDAFARESRAILGRVTNSYVVKDRVEAKGGRLITLAWSAAQGQSSFAGVTLAVEALDPLSKTFPLPSSAYPKQHAVKPIDPDSVAFVVPEAKIEPAGIAHRVTVDGLNVLATENALAAVQIERNRLSLSDAKRTEWATVDAFVYKTPRVRPSQPVTPFIDVEPPPYIDVATLPAVDGGTGCPGGPKTLCRRILAMMSALLADPTHAPSLLAARARGGSDDAAVRRLKVGCSLQFALAAVSGVADQTLVPRVPVALARSFDIDGGDVGQLEDFAARFAGAISAWAAARDIVFGPHSEPKGAALLFDITLYAGLSGANTPVLRLGNLRLRLKDIDAA